MGDPLPHDDPAERAVLGAILLEPDRAYEAVSLSPLSFYSDKHRVIFRGIADCLVRYKTADLVLLGQVLSNGKMEDAGGQAYLLNLLDGVARSTNLPHYVGILLDFEARRAAIVGATQIAALARQERVADVATAIQAFAASIAKREVRDLRVVTMESLLAPLEPVPWVAEGWLGRGDICTFAGEWATGKSVIAMDLALSVAAGIPWMGHVPIAQQGPAIYVDEENNERNIRRRLRRMALGRKIADAELPNLPLRYLCRNHLRLRTPRGMSVLRGECERLRPSVLIFDTFIRVAGGDENTSADVSAVVSDCLLPLATEFDVAIVVLDHMRKPTKDDKESDAGHRIRGSGDKAGAPDDVWTLSGSREDPKRSLSCSKCRWTDSLPSPITTEWNVSEDEDAGWLSARDSVLLADAALVLIVQEAGDEGIFATQLIHALERRGIALRTAQRTVKRCRLDGTVDHRLERGGRIRYLPRKPSKLIP